MNDFLPDSFWDEPAGEPKPSRFMVPHEQHEYQVHTYPVKAFVVGVMEDLLVSTDREHWGFYSNGTHYDPSFRFDASRASEPFPEEVTHVLWFG